MTYKNFLATNLLVLVCITTLSGCSDIAPNVETKIASQPILSAPAELLSLQDVTIGPPNVNRMWQFKIEYLAPENTLVKEGDVVVRFDGQQLRDDLLEKVSALDAAKKEAEKKQLKDKETNEDLVLDLAEAKMNMEIAQRKVEITDASRSEIERQKQAAEYKITKVLYAQAQQKLAQHQERMKINIEVQKAKIMNLQVRVNNIRDSLDKLVIKAPKPGLVVYKADWEDNKPTVGATVYMGSTLITLPSLDKIAVKVEFDESDTSKVHVGQSVKVLLDSHPEKPFSGTITSLGQAYRNRSQNNLKVVFDARVELDKLAEDIMRPGMKANVQILQDDQL